MQKSLPYVIVLLVFWTFALMNIYSSQQYSSLLGRIILGNDVKDVKQFLAYIEDTPHYTEQYTYFNARLNNSLAQEDITAQYSINSEIAKYQGLLAMNAENPNLMTKLALLFLDKGEKMQAKTLYSEAKRIDPWIRVTELERLQ